MQTPKSRPGSLDVSQKPSVTTPRTARKLKTPGSDSDSVSSPNPVSKTPKNRSSKVVNRGSPKTPATEKKKLSRVPEFEPQLAQLQEELKKVKDQLTSSESSNKRAQEEVEESKKQLTAMSAKLEETQKQLYDLSYSEESRVQELRKISQERDKSWQTELEAMQKQHSMDSTALASAMAEIQRLKIQLDRVSESEASQARHAESAHGEIQSLRVELTETLELVEKLKNQLNESRESEAEALGEVCRAQMELEVVKSTEVKLQFENAFARESYKSLLMEMEQSKDKVSSLEEIIANLQADLANARKISAYSSDVIEKSSEIEEVDEPEILKTELNNLKHEESRLRAALEDTERRYHDGYVQSTLQIRNAYELVEREKLESSHKEAEMDAKLKESEAEIEELRVKFIEKENELQSVLSVNLNIEETQPIELEKSESLLEDMKMSLLEKENQFQKISEENEMLKTEIRNWEIERCKAIDEARAAEREASMKLGFLTEEADKSCRKAARVTEQLDAAQVANSEMEAEFRRLKVQSDQWRKAAEAAAAMLSTGNNGKLAERTGSFDYHTIGGKLESAYADDIDDDSPKKKNGNMLRKIGVLLKKK